MLLPVIMAGGGWQPLVAAISNPLPQAILGSYVRVEYVPRNLT